jgi:hypothetical protein
MSSLLRLLVCPRCRGSLSEKQCQNCQLNFNQFGQVLAFFANEKLARAQWHQKLSRFREGTQAKRAKAEETAKKHEVARERLQIYGDALKSQQQDVSHLLQNFGLNDADSKLLDVLAQRIPSTQHIESYFQNIFRDWAWDGTDNEIYAQMVSDMLSVDSSIPLVVLGSGPSRLAFDCAVKRNLQQLILVDINPLFLEVAARMTSNQKLELTEINPFPNSLQNISKRWKLKSMAGPKKCLFLWADGINLPLQNGSDVHLLTPWFIDVIPEDFASLAARFNARLKTGNYWVNFGPLGFGHSERARSYTNEEIKKLLEKSGFTIEDWQEAQVPYLNSPLSPQTRHEKVFCWRAKKVSDVKEPAEFRYYPQWLTDHSVKIPVTAKFQEQGLQNLFTGQIFSAIDGKISLAELSERLAQNFGTTKVVAEETLLGIFSQWLETNEN